MKHIREAAVSLALVTVIVIIWCIIYGRTSLAAWNTPVAYGGDATCGLAYAQAFLNGETVPVLQKFVKSLNAPFVANWNDFPVPKSLFLQQWAGWDEA